MIDSNRPPFGDLSHTLVIGPCRTGMTRVPFLHQREGGAFEWKPTPGAHHHRVWALTGKGMSCVDGRSGGQER